ncbi:50S ribosomal protein L21 [Candidatus Uhrbacteria bacterium]|nr:50S ribosomal protein L21 [Candidatus Uhrbacteria bacterium]
MFAVIATGGKQYLVHEGQVLKVEKLEQAVGAPLEFDALLVAEEDGGQITVGKPGSGKMVSATVVEHGRSEKISVIKYKAKVRYRRKAGHRQPFTSIKIEKIA